MNTYTQIEQEHAAMVSRSLMKNPDELQASSTPLKWALIHAVFGIAGELAKLEDYSDKDNLVEESGDILFYCRNLRQVLNLPEYSAGNIKPVSAFVLAGDLLDVAKRIAIYSYEITDERLATFTEIVDNVEHVVEQALASYGITREQALSNLDKLLTGAKARYKAGYSDAAAQARADKQTDESA
jgi:hypothetical protein